MMKEFKAFIQRGNVMDLAIGIIIGGAFGKIIASLVGDILMPLIGMATGGVNFADKYIALDGKTYASLAAAQESGGAILRYGAFIQSIIDFLVIAFCVFLIVRALNRMKRPQAAAPVTTKICPLCKTEIPLDAVKCPHCTGDLNG